MRQFQLISWRGIVDELIKKVTEKAGINADQAKNAVSAVVEFLKTKFPAIGEQVSGAISGGSGAGGALGSVRDKLGL